MNARKMRMAAIVLMAGLSGTAQGAVTYVDPGASSPDLTFSTVPVSGEYSGTTVISQMIQTGPSAGPVVGGGGFSLMFGGTAMRVDFSSPLSFVSVDFIPNDTDTGVLQAYSAEGLLLGEQVGRYSTPLTFTLSLSSSSTPFAYILATYADSGNIGRVGYEVAAVPEPETYGMFLAGLGLIGLVIRTNRKYTN